MNKKVKNDAYSPKKDTSTPLRKENNYPFGFITLVKNVVKAIKDGAIPSVVFANSFGIAKDTKIGDLNITAFVYRPNENENKVMSRLIDELKKPNVDVQKITTDALLGMWTEKKRINVNKTKDNILVRKTIDKPKMNKSKVVDVKIEKKPIEVVIRKSKLAI